MLCLNNSLNCSSKNLAVQHCSKKYKNSGIIFVVSYILTTLLEPLICILACAVQNLMDCIGNFLKNSFYRLNRHDDSISVTEC